MPYINSVVFIPLDGGEKETRFEFTPPLSIYEIMVKTGISGDSFCGGNHNCGRCYVWVKGGTGDLLEDEKSLIKRIKDSSEGPDDKACELRLACFCVLTDDAVVYYAAADDGFELLEADATPAKHPAGEIEFAAAIDIGTTTVELALFEAVSQKRVFYKREANTQRMYGADVLSRIEWSNRNGKELQHHRIIEQTEKMLDEAARKLAVKSENIKSVVVTGNTTMLHFFENLDPKGIGVSPFLPECLFGITKPARSAYRMLAEDAWLYLPPCVGPYIGADISCGILAAELDRPGRIALLVDVGTNGEIALFDGSDIYCCSTAAGPAFEGGEIAMGMVAAAGAVDKVWYKDGEINYSVINGGSASGVCGTGIISAVSALIEAGLVDSSGRITAGEGRLEDLVFETGGQKAVYIAAGAVYMTQQDIRNIQLAKAAVAAGIEALLYKTGITVCQVDSLYLCGGFGSGIQTDSAAAIGLLPRELADKTIVMGNSALAGAAMLLFSAENKKRIEKIVKQSEELSLSADAYFMERYVENMSFSVSAGSV